MIKLIISFLFIFQTSVYSLSFSTLDGEAVSMSAFQGKKILLVNIATGSKLATQLQDLEQLQQQYRDKLIVIAFPSNSFSREQRSNAEIKAFCRDTYRTSFLIAEKKEVAGSEVQPVYQWLTTQSENGMMQGEIKGDFQKFLIDEKGNLVGVFASNVSPLDPQLLNAISTVY